MLLILNLLACCSLAGRIGSPPRNVNFIALGDPVYFLLSGWALHILCWDVDLPWPRNYKVKWRWVWGRKQRGWPGQKFCSLNTQWKLEKKPKKISLPSSHIPCLASASALGPFAAFLSDLQFGLNSITCAACTCLNTLVYLTFTLMGLGNWTRMCEHTDN